MSSEFGSHRLERAAAKLGWLALIASLGSTGCGEDAPACSLEARSSVVVDVVDAARAPATDATVVYTLDGGAVTPATSGCPGDGGCDRWTAGVEQTGRFHLTATRASTGGQTQRLVEITRDECHVITQSVTLKVP